MVKHLKIKRQCLRVLNNFILREKKKKEIKIKLSHFVIVVLLLTKEFVND